MNTAAGRVIGAENTMQNISVLMCRFFFDKYNVVHTTYSIIPITIIARSRCPPVYCRSRSRIFLRWYIVYIRC